jgi:hypothetical protein
MTLMLKLSLKSESISLGELGAGDSMKTSEHVLGLQFEIS